MKVCDVMTLNELTRELNTDRKREYGPGLILVHSRYWPLSGIGAAAHEGEEDDGERNSRVWCPKCQVKTLFQEGRKE